MTQSVQRPPFAGIGKRNIAYLLFVAFLTWPRAAFDTDPAGRGMAEGFKVIVWWMVTAPFAIWNFWALLGAEGAMRKPGIALLLVLAFLLAGHFLNRF